jgi:hypothetical protein
MSLRRRLRVTRYRVGRSIRRRRILAPTVLGGSVAVAALLLVAVVAQSAPPAERPAPSPTTTTRPRTNATAAPPTVPMGVYVGPGDPAAAEAFRADIGAPVAYALDYFDDRSWQSIADPSWFLQQWAGSGFTMIWAVPMLPVTGGSLALGATGAYDSVFTQLAETLVAGGQAGAILELGANPEAPNVPWTVTTSADAADYVAYWRQIVSTMRAVPGQDFKFVWDVTAGSLDPSTVYPGNAYVDLIGTDLFDVAGAAGGTTFSDLASAPLGLDWFATFAHTHRKGLFLAKWGVVPTTDGGGGDNATFVRHVLSWASQNHVVAVVTWDDGSWAITGGGFPEAAQVLHSVASAGSVSPIARAVNA